MRWIEKLVAEFRKEVQKTSIRCKGEAKSEREGNYSIAIEDVIEKSHPSSDSRNKFTEKK